MTLLDSTGEIYFKKMTKIRARLKHHQRSNFCDKSREQGKAESSDFWKELLVICDKVSTGSNDQSIWTKLELKFSFVWYNQPGQLISFNSHFAMVAWRPKQCAAPTPISLCSHWLRRRSEQFPHWAPPPCGPNVGLSSVSTWNLDAYVGLQPRKVSNNFPLLPSSLGKSYDITYVQSPLHI